jgi:sterol 3beta-glucosyltransferase
MTHRRIGPRRIAIVASGSMGDVRPYGVLAAAFARAGWDAGLVANDGYAATSDSLGVPWFIPGLPPLDHVMAWQRRQNAQEPGIFDAGLWDAWFAAYPALVRALAGADVIVSRIPWIVLAPNLPREGPRTDLPRVPVGTAIGPMVRRRRVLGHVPGVVATLNLATHAGLISDRIGLLWQERRSIGELMRLQRRHHAALASLAGPDALVRLKRPIPPLLEIVGLSQHVLPPRKHERFTGTWRTPTASYTPPPALARLLDSGEPPVFIGFGSVPCMPSGDDFASLSQMVGAAVQQSGVRAVIAPGWGGLRWPEETAGQADPDKVVAIDGVPHDWLFPRLGAVVHHCGVGTAMAALAAGTPSVPVPFLQDEPFWAWRLHDLGVAPPPIDPVLLTPPALAGAMRAALDNAAIRVRAAALGQAMRAEDGLATAVHLVEEALETREATHVAA